MQTFLPYSNYLESAKILDKKRCWKQVVEASQIISVLEKKRDLLYIGDLYGAKKLPWVNHPAVKMWDGYPLALREYFNAFLWVSKHIHGIKTKYTMLETYEGAGMYPWWLGNPQFHRAMRARLIAKDPEFYGSKFPDKDKGYNGGKYWWPDMELKTFKII
jgi:hypothetical protein